MSMYELIKRLQKISIAACFCLIAFSTVALADSSWSGDYVFVERGVDSKAKAVSVRHLIRVRQNEQGQYWVRLYSVGYRTNKDIFGQAKQNDAKLEIFFERMGSDHKQLKHDSNDPLLILDNSSGVLKTKWQGTLPTFRRNNSGGANQFAKVDGSQLKQSKKWVYLNPERAKLSLVVPDTNYINKKKIGDVVFSVWGNAGNLRFNIVSSTGRLGAVKSRLRRSIKKGATHIHDRKKFMLINYPLTRNSNSSFSKSVSLISQNYAYRINFEGPIDSAIIANDLISSILLEGKNVWGYEPPIVPNSILSLRDAFTSSEFEKFRKPSNKDFQRKVTNALNFDESRMPADDSEIKAVIHTVDLPKKYFKEEVVTWMEIRADGRVGDLKFISSLDDKRLNEYVESALKTRFIPAKRNGEYVTTWYRWDWQPKFIRFVLRRTDLL